MTKPREHICYHFLSHEKVFFCDIFPSFFTARCLLSLDALKSALTILTRITHAHFNKPTESRLLRLHATQNRYLLRPVYD